jgi:hypothetical protein
MVLPPPGKPPPLIHTWGVVQSELEAQTRLEPIGHEPTWQDAFAGPPGKGPPPVVQHTSPALQPPAVQDGGRQVIEEPGKPAPAQVCPPGHSLALMHGCVEPAGQAAMHDVVLPLPPPNGPPPPPSPVGTWQQTSPLEQLDALEHDVTTIVPDGHRSALDTQV